MEDEIEEEISKEVRAFVALYSPCTTVNCATNPCWVLKLVLLFFFSI